MNGVQIRYFRKIRLTEPVSKPEKTMQSAHPKFRLHMQYGRPFLRNGLIIQTKVSTIQAIHAADVKFLFLTF
jgi:hypothetical protein